MQNKVRRIQNPPDFALIDIHFHTVFIIAKGLSHTILNPKHNVRVRMNDHAEKRRGSARWTPPLYDLYVNLY